MESKENKNNHSNQDMPKKDNVIKKILKWIMTNLYSIIHVIVFLSLTIYIILNWNLCISMQLFSQFNGNNILFVVWIVLIFLLLYEVEAKDIKLKRHRVKEELENASKLYTIELLSKNQALNNCQEGDINNGPSNQNNDC